MTITEFLKKHEWLLKILIAICSILGVSVFFINVITIQSYPTVGWNWTIEFKTYGAKPTMLNITGINETEFDKDLDFVSLNCGDNEVVPDRDGNTYSVNWYCNELGILNVIPRTTGVHILEFRYGNDKAYAYNNASLNIDYLFDKEFDKLSLYNLNKEVFIRLDLPSNYISKVENKARQKMEYKYSSFDINIYPFLYEKTPAIEYEIILKQKPLVNSISIPFFYSNNLDFYYQAPLNQEIKDESLICNETACLDKEGNRITYRPDYIIGSYAVYTKSSITEIGKVFHIYRPKITDAKGNSIWGDLNILNNALTIIINQTFLNNAVYPVTIDPSFGYSKAGASFYSMANEIIGSNFTLTNGTGTIDNITWYLDMSAQSTVRCAIYGNATNNGMLVGNTSSWTGTVYSTWTTFNFTDPKPTIYNGTNYALVCWSNTSNCGGFYDSVGKSRQYVLTYNGNNWPNPVTTWTVNSVTFSVYASYTLTAPPSAKAQTAVPVIQNTINSWWT